MHWILIWFGTLYGPRGSLQNIRVYTSWQDARNYDGWFLVKRGDSTYISFRHVGRGIFRADRLAYLSQRVEYLHDDSDES